MHNRNDDRDPICQADCGKCGQLNCNERLEPAGNEAEGGELRAERKDSLIHSIKVAAEKNMAFRKLNDYEVKTLAALIEERDALAAVVDAIGRGNLCLLCKHELLSDDQGECKECSGGFRLRGHFELKSPIAINASYNRGLLLRFLQFVDAKRKTQFNWIDLDADISEFVAELEGKRHEQTK